MKRMKKQGFTLVEIMIVVAIIGLLAAIGIPSFRKARRNTLQKTAINNARQVISAVDQYSLEKALTDGAAVGAADVDNYIKGGTAALRIGSVAAAGLGNLTVGLNNAEELGNTMYPNFF